VTALRGYFPRSACGTVDYADNFEVGTALHYRQMPVQCYPAKTDCGYSKFLHGVTCGLTVILPS
jgi:hypothetical protein